MNGQNMQKSHFRSIVETAVIVFVLGYGLHYIGYFLRQRYFNLLEGLSLDTIIEVFELVKKSL